MIQDRLLYMLNDSDNTKLSGVKKAYISRMIIQATSVYQKYIQDANKQATEQAIKNAKLKVTTTTSTSGKKSSTVSLDPSLYRGLGDPKKAKKEEELPLAA